MTSRLVWEENFQLLNPTCLAEPECYVEVDLHGLVDLLQAHSLKPGPVEDTSIVHQDIHTLVVQYNK